MTEPTGRTRAEESETVVLANGTPVKLIARDGGWTLQVNGIRHSHVGAPGQAPALASVRWMLAAVGADRGRLVHLGGGLLTLPRAVSEASPHVRQLVVEIDAVLAALVRDRFGLPDDVELIVDDARAWLDAGGSTPLSTACDAVVIDVFVGGRVPPSFTSQECFSRARSLLNADGVLVLNSVAGAGLTFTRRQLATLRAEFEHVALIVQGSALHGLRFGNAVMIGSTAPIEVERIKSELAGDASRGALVTELDDLIGDADVVTDADGLWSPEPDLPDVSGALRLLDQARCMSQAFAPRQDD